MAMTQEEKQLLLKDLCARLLYEVILLSPNNKITYQTDGNTAAELLIEEGWKPYLRPMSSMTEEEWEELNYIGYIVPLYDGCFGVDMRAYCKISKTHYRRFSEFSTIEDWLNAHHFDYRGLIEKGLALEAPDGIYNIKEHNKI